MRLCQQVRVVFAEEGVFLTSTQKFSCELSSGFFIRGSTKFSCTERVRQKDFHVNSTSLKIKIINAPISPTVVAQSRHTAP